MKSFKTNKKGISLIVLILTIIVMIILATAIILSLNNSGIIGKANKAKRASDYASLKEYANVLQAEYELMSDAERTGYDSGIDYANAKLEAEGYKQRLNADGILLSEGAVKALADGIEIGDEIKGYNSYLTSKTGEDAPSTSGNENTMDPENDLDYGDYDCSDTHYGVFDQTIENRTDFTWEYIGVSNDGKIMITPVLENDTTENPIPKMTLSGIEAYRYAPDELNTICQALYGTSKGIARSMNIEDINRLLNYTPNTPIGFREYLENESSDYIEWGYVPSLPAGLGIDDFELNSYFIRKSETSVSDEIKNVVFCDVNYWLSSSAFDSDGTYNYFSIRYVSSDSVGNNILYYSMCTKEPTSKAVRPVVLLNTDVSLTKVSDGNWSIN